MSEPSTFLTDAEVVQLTGRKQRGTQIEALRTMGIAFFVNALGKPIVARAVIEGRANQAPTPKTAWQPRVLSFKGR